MKLPVAALLFLCVTSLPALAGHCEFDVGFKKEPTEKNQTIQLNPAVKMELKQFVSTQVADSARIASNVTCQHLSGHNYTGSEAEWAGFIDSGIKGLVKAGFKGLQFTKVGEEDAIYTGALPHMEYRFNGDIGGNKQIIHNLAVLNKDKNEVYTLSVSGNEKVANAISNEFTRLVGSFKIK